MPETFAIPKETQDKFYQPLFLVNNLYGLHNILKLQSTPNYRAEYILSIMLIAVYSVSESLVD
jgi:hypothetical protein